MRLQWQVSMVQIASNFLSNVLKADGIDDEDGGGDDDGKDEEEDDDGGCPDCAEFPVQCALS